MERNKWLWIFVLFAILSIIVFAITLNDVLEIEILYVNIIRAVFVILALFALLMAFVAKK